MSYGYIDGLCGSFLAHSHANALAIVHDFGLYD